MKLCVEAGCVRATVSEKVKFRGLITIFPERKRIIHCIHILPAHKSTQLENKMIHKGAFTEKPV
jgi:hypothetical protein